MISNIQRFSIHDGPGIRTTVFFKGCPLHCLWCANPETQQGKRELMHRSQNCLQCGQCTAACPAQAISFEDTTFSWDASRCTFCGACIKACPHRLLKIQGEDLSANEIFDIVLRDRVFYENSGGGMTLSGGEPMMQPQLASELLRLAKQSGINTCIETCLHYPFERLEAVLENLDYIYFDLKHVDIEKHKNATGQDPSLILDNIGTLLSLRPDANMRIPVIPGFNDTKEDIDLICAKLHEWQVKEVELMRYHNWATAKYHALGRDYAYEDISRYEDAAFEQIKMRYQNNRIAIS